ENCLRQSSNRRFSSRHDGRTREPHMAMTAELNRRLLQWKELRQQGKQVSAEELCADCPELLKDIKRIIHALEHLGLLPDPASEVPTATPLANATPSTPGGPTPSLNPRVEELLLRWEELREQGKEIAAEELCAEAPELAGELRRRLEQLRSFPRESGGTAPARTT